MFGINRKSKFIEVTKLSSLVADNVEINGDIVFSDGLRIDGRINGNLVSRDEAKGLLVVSEKGCIVGNVLCHDAVINGEVRGDIEVTHFLELQSSAHVSGNITYRQLQMECGAAVDGKLLSRQDAVEANNVVEASNVVELPDQAARG
ncbi:MAG: polymer-forming cytoskeletal protein [Zoogloea sp.]|nr:polymer-forming cytoskeletal protein [Zoogloea sp.]